jgi:tetratricopeptide (TPR) repeat protein
MIRPYALAACIFLAGSALAQAPMASPNSEARRYFSEGLADIYGFDFQAAVNAFHRASQLDPKSPMPYWGIALANGPNYNAWTPTPARQAASIGAIRIAERLAADAPAPEHAYVKALAACFPKAPRACADAMRAVYRAYPDDPDAAVLYAASLMNINPWHLWSVDGKAGTDTAEIVAVLEAVLHRWPDHLGANHYYIHAMEGSQDPERALPSAHRLETLAPAAAHLVHMPSHIYLRTGDYAEAVKCNQRAVALDEAGEHNYFFLAAAANMDGEYQVAADAAAKLQMHAHSGAFLVMPMVVLLRFARWDEVLALPAPTSEMEGVAYFRHYARGVAFAAKGQPEEAARERKAMDQEYAKLKPGRAFGMYFNDWNAIHKIASDVLDARIASARKDVPTAIRLWASAAALQDQLNFDDVPDWYYPARESWGAELLRSGDAVQAEQVFREDLRRNPRNPRSLFGLSEALSAQKKDATPTRQEFEAAWKGTAPPKLDD